MRDNQRSPCGPGCVEGMRECRGLTYLEELALRRTEVGHVALILLLHLLWQFSAEFLFFSAPSCQLELTNFQPVEFRSLAPVARRAEHEVLVETWKESEGVSRLVSDYVGLRTKLIGRRKLNV